MKTNKNNLNENKEVEFNNPLLKKISKLVKDTLDKGEIQAMEKQYGFNKTILEIIKSEDENLDLAIFLVSEVSFSYFSKFKNLHTNKTFLKYSILKNSNLFNSIESELKNDIEIGFYVIESMVREGKSIIEIEKFINKNFSDKSQILLLEYKQILSKTFRINGVDLTKQLLNLKILSPEFYKKIISLKIFNINGIKTDFNSKIIEKIVSDFLLDESYNKLDDTEKEKYKIKFLEGFFDLNFDKSSEDEKYFFNTFLKLLSLSESKIINKNKSVDKTDKIKDNDNKEINSKNKTLNNINVLDENELNNFCTFTDYSYPGCNVSEYGSGYNIKTTNGTDIFISKSEKENFTLNALSNYVKFHNTMNNLGLGFLWSKYSSDFKTLCNMKFGFNYMSGDGITEGKTLSVLNMIGRNIGVPEKEILDENGEKIKEIKCFTNLADAKNTFSNIKESGKINGVIYSDNSMFSNGAVENKLIEVLCINEKRNGLNIIKWK